MEGLVWVQRGTCTEPIMTSCWAFVYSSLEVIWHLCGWLICMTSGKRKESATLWSLLRPKVKTGRGELEMQGERNWAGSVCLCVLRKPSERSFNKNKGRKLSNLIMRLERGFSTTADPIFLNYYSKPTLYSDTDTVIDQNKINKYSTRVRVRVEVFMLAENVWLM